jgi:hypothetical protein
MQPAAETEIGLLDIPSEVWEVVFRHLPHTESHRVTFLSKVSIAHLQTIFLSSKSPLRFVARGSNLCDSLVRKYEAQARKLQQVGAAPAILDILATCHAEAVQAIQAVERIALAALPLSGLCIALVPFTEPDPAGGSSTADALARALPHLSAFHSLDFDLGPRFTSPLLVASVASMTSQQNELSLQRQELF